MTDGDREVDRSVETRPSTESDRTGRRDSGGWDAGRWGSGAAREPDDGESENTPTPETPSDHAEQAARESSTTTARMRIPDSLPEERPTRLLVICVDEALRHETVKNLQIDGPPGWEPDAAGDSESARLKLVVEEWDAVILRLDGGAIDHRSVCRAAHTAQRMKPPPVLVIAPLNYDLERELQALGVNRILRSTATSEVIAHAVEQCLGSTPRGPTPGALWEEE